LRVFAFAFLLGVLLLQQQPSLPQAYTGGLLLVLLSGISACFARRAPTRAKSFAVATTLAMLGAGLGFGFAQWRAELRMAEALSPSAEGVDIAMVGVVRGLPQTHERGVRFVFDVETALAPASGAVPKLPARVSLTWYHEAERRNRPATPTPKLQPGERWQVTVRLRQPHGFANPHGFDFELWALERNLRATGYVRAAAGANNRRLAAEVPGVAHRIDRLRLALAERVRQSVPAPGAGVLVALIIGEQNAIAQDQWRTFWRTGVGHLMSISGLHVTMLAALAAWFARAGWLRIPRAPLVLPARVFGVWVGALTATWYALIAGFSVPTQRTLYMILVVALALLMRRQVAATRVLATALLAVLLLDPWAALSAGFWLSFGAVAAIFYIGLGRSSTQSPWASGARTQVAITVLMVPASLMLFQEVSLVSPIANALAIPVVSLAIVPLALAGAFLDAPLILALANQLLAWLMLPLQALAALPEATWQSHAPHPLAIAAALVGGLVLLTPRAVPYRWLALPLLLPLFWLKPAAPAQNTAQVTVLDVGQGLAVVVRTANHALVYDTGASFGPDNDAGSRVLVPFLRGEGITKLDKLIVTHDDDDHFGGAVSLINARQPHALMTSLPSTHRASVAARAGGAHVSRCEAGHSWAWDGVQFEVLHPDSSAYASRAQDARAPRDNDMSCVLEVATAGANVLLTADIEAASETELLGRLGRGLQADILLVPHHGSKTSSTAQFLAAVRPDLALLSVGYRNRFRHPHPTIVERYNAANVPIYRTDAGGALRLTLPASVSDIAVHQHRAEARRYWRPSPDFAATSPE
jgi:competence protein ComEC